MSESQPVYAMTAVQLADMHELSARRVRQYQEDGRITALARGLFDAGWFSHLRIGEAVCMNLRHKPSTNTLVAVGWFLAVGKRVTVEDRKYLVELFKRNGKSAEDALVALGEAQAVLWS